MLFKNKIKFIFINTFTNIIYIDNIITIRFEYINISF